MWLDFIWLVRLFWPVCGDGMVWLLVPGLWVGWFLWVFPLVGFVACGLVVGSSILFSLVAYAWAVGGGGVVYLFPRGWARFGFLLD